MPYDSYYLTDEGELHVDTHLTSLQMIDINIIVAIRNEVDLDTLDIDHGLLSQRLTALRRLGYLKQEDE